MRLGCLGLLVASALQAAISYQGSADLGTTTLATYPVSYTVTGGSTLLVVVISGDTSTDKITGVTYNGVSMTLGDKCSNAGGRWLYLYYLLSPGVGAHNVVVSASPASFMAVVAADYAGVNTSGQPDAATSGGQSSASSSQTVTLTTVANNCWTLLGFAGYNANLPPTAGTGSTRRVFQANFGLPALFDSGGPITPAGSYSMTAAYGGSNNSGAVMVSFSPIVVAPTTPIRHKTSVIR